MGQYTVALVHQVEATSHARAVDLAFATLPTSIHVRQSPEQSVRHRRRDSYTSPAATLDAAWDEYLGRLAIGHPTDGGGAPALPSLEQLARAGIDPAALSLIFDIAITASRRRPDAS